MTDKELVEKTISLCEEHNATLLYLTKFGSHLYGTNTPTSDTDVRGVFLPSKKELLLGNHRKGIDYSTGKNNDKNSAADIDISLFSLQEFLLRLLPVGETSSSDILFSYSNQNCRMYINDTIPLVKDLFIDNPFHYMNPNKITAYSSYCIHQAHKYGIKGSRLGALIKAHKWLHNRFDKISPKDLHVIRIQDFIDDFLNECTDKNFCRKYVGDDEITSGILILGKIFTNRTPLKIFMTHVDNSLDKFGKRAEAAMNNDGVDWKAISHALRALEQMRQLLTDGKIVFPLVNREYLIKVKSGLLDYSVVEDEIVNKLEYIQTLQKKTISYYGYDIEELKNKILACYSCF